MPYLSCFSLEYILLNIFINSSLVIFLSANNAISKLLIKSFILLYLYKDFILVFKYSLSSDCFSKIIISPNFSFCLFSSFILISILLVPFLI